MKSLSIAYIQTLIQKMYHKIVELIRMREFVIQKYLK